MKRLTALAIAVGAVGFVALLARLDVARVVALVAAAGWGVPLILGQEVVAHVLNALGWRWASDPRHAASVPLRRLIELRVAGDAINYLTPSATVAGEVGRTTMLKSSHPTGAEAASVVVAKVAQTTGQALFVAAGILLFARGHVRLATPPGWVSAGAIIVLLLALTVIFTPLRRVVAARMPAARLRGSVAEFLRRHRRRFLISTALFAAGYLWGAVEASIICRCLGLDLPIATVLAIEALSAGVDGVLFVVPAKIGVQEGGKTAIFAVLGLPPAAGFAFGLLRHLRELVWAGAGLLLCAGAWRAKPSGRSTDSRSIVPRTLSR